MLFLLALLSAPNAMSAIRRNFEPPPTMQMPEVVVTPADVATADPALVGSSGSLRAVIGTKEALEANAALEPYLADASLDPGVHPLEVLPTTIPWSRWPCSRSTPRAAGSTRVLHRSPGEPRAGAKNPSYAPPQATSATPENENTPVSQRFKPDPHP